jgi:hypothetical protein
MWNHADWLALEEDLQRRGLGRGDMDRVGRVLERRRVEYWNLRRWRDSGEAWRWVEARHGEWAHHDWMTLLAGLQCWLGPLDPAAVGQTLETMKRQYRGLEQWIRSGAPARWVEEHGGRWEHADWEQLLAALERSPHGSLVPAQVGRVLEECKRAYWNVRRWEASGEPSRWVEACRGTWNHANWERLLAGLRASEFWPMAPEAVGAVLERARKRYQDLQRWVQSGAARLWVAMRGGQWTEADLLDLLAVLGRTEQIEVDPQALREVLQRLREEYENLRRWLEKVPDIVRRGSAACTAEGPLLIIGRWLHGAWQEDGGRRAA